MFLVEYAKSGRSGCRSCHGQIEKGTLRLGELVKSNRHSGLDPHWFHASCFVKKHPHVTVDQFHKFYDLVPEDQELILRCLAGDIFAPSLTSTAPSTKPQPVEREPIQNSGVFWMEYAKSNQSRCISCEGRIIKGEVRISQKDFQSKGAKRVPGGMDRWHHVDCFSKNRLVLEFSGDGGSIPGIEGLRRSDQEMIGTKLPPLEEGSATGQNPSEFGDGNIARRRPWSDPGEKENNFEEMDYALVAKVREQDALIEGIEVRLREDFNGALKDDKDKLAEILRHNHQDVCVTAEKMIERIADMMVFGALERCSVCKGQLVLRPGIGYYCIGYISDFAKCTKMEREPQRRSFSIPEDLKSNPVFKDYTFIPRTRIILPRRSRDEPPRKLPKIDKLPLFNCKFMISDHLSPNLASEVGTQLQEFGGKIVTRLGKQISAIISTSAEVEFMSRRMEFAQSNGIPVLSTDFVRAITTTDFEIDVVMKKHLLSTWICVFPSSTSTPTPPPTATISSYAPPRVSMSSPVVPLGCISSYFVN